MRIHITNIIVKNVFSFYYVSDIKISYIESFVIVKGLSEAALIGLCSVLFGSGYKGKGIAGDKKLQKVRDEIIKRTASKLEYDENAFREYIKNLKKIRDKIVAHYDGSKADYSEEMINQYDTNGNLIGKVPAISTMKMPSAHFSTDEIRMMKKTAIFLNYSLRNILLENA